MTFQRYQQLLVKHPAYYRGRWEYIGFVSGLIAGLNPATILELGPAYAPIEDWADTMDLRAKGDFKVTYLTDATHTPWPIPTKRYDLFVGLQVFEHLAGCQADVFEEVRRVSRQAILSVPYRWQCPQDPIHHGVDDAVIRRWTADCPPWQTFGPFGAAAPRVVWYWRF